MISQRTKEFACYVSRHITWLSFSHIVTKVDFASLVKRVLLAALQLNVWKHGSNLFGISCVATCASEMLESLFAEQNSPEVVKKFSDFSCRLYAPCSCYITEGFSLSWIWPLRGKRHTWLSKVSSIRDSSLFFSFWGCCASVSSLWNALFTVPLSLCCSAFKVLLLQAKNIYCVDKLMWYTDESFFCDVSSGKAA